MIQFIYMPIIFTSQFLLKMYMIFLTIESNKSNKLTLKACKELVCAHT